MSAEFWLQSISVFVFGLLWGSFANVVILRWPKGENFISDRSRCPSCKNQIAWFDNIPLLSWIFLKAKCRNCKNPISIRYPLVELVTGILFLMVFLKFGVSWRTLELLYFTWALVVVSVIDLDHMLLPDLFTLSGIVIGLLGAALVPERDFMSAFWGVLLGGGFLWAIAYFYLLVRKQEGMGGGDIKLLAWIGAVLGWTAIPFVVLVSSVLGSLVGLILAVRSKAGLKSEIPFGPYLALAAILYFLGGEALGLWYVGLFLPSLTPVN